MRIRVRVRVWVRVRVRVRVWVRVSFRSVAILVLQTRLFTVGRCGFEGPGGVSKGRQPLCFTKKHVLLTFITRNHQLSRRSGSGAREEVALLSASWLAEGLSS